MRSDFVRQMQIEMERNAKIVFLTGDLGYNAIEPLAAAFPDRFYNVGIAEQNMIGLASGLALSGHTVVAYSIASFLTMRCYEQIRNDACYHNLDVKLIGTGGGYNYSDNGVTHHTVEDVALMAALPHMRVLCPSYSWEAREGTQAIMRSPGPAYLRLGKSPGIPYEKASWEFKLGTGYQIKSGKDIILFLTGNITDIAFAVAATLEQKLGMTVGIISLPSVKPLDTKLVLKTAAQAKGVFTIEEHGLYGGLGSLVALLLQQASVRVSFKAFAIGDTFVKHVGTREYLCEAAGIGAKQIALDIQRIVQKKK